MNEQGVDYSILLYSALTKKLNVHLVHLLFADGRTKEGHVLINTGIMEKPFWKEPHLQSSSEVGLVRYHDSVVHLDFY